MFGEGLWAASGVFRAQALEDVACRKGAAGWHWGGVEQPGPS